jgi:exopolysaccharide biosynthesis protein
VFAAVPGISLRAETETARPYAGVTYVVRAEETPRPVKMHIVEIDLTAPGIRFRLTGPGGGRETVRQTTLEYLEQERAQLAVNAHFFTPFPSKDREVYLVGLAGADGELYSGCEMPEQSYAIVANAPAIAIDDGNHASLVHCDPAFSDGKHLKESVAVGTVVSGSAQVITNGEVTIPEYADVDHPNALLTPGGPRKYSNAKSWYEQVNARTVMGLSRDRKRLVLFTVDRASRSKGMTLREAAELLLRDYGVWDALNLDGGGSTTLAMEDPVTHGRSVVNASSDNPKGRSVGSNLAVFAEPAGVP